MSKIISLLTRSAAFACVALLCVLGSTLNAEAQKVRLRSQTTPPCTTSPGSSGTVQRFADLYGEGNIAVMGSFICRGGFIFDITNPDSPVLANVYNPGLDMQFLEAVVVGGRAYFGSGNGGGVHILNVANPYSPAFLGKVDSSTGGGHDSVHEIMVIPQGASIYLIENYNSTGIRPIKIIDVTNPAAPVLKWEFSPIDSIWVHAFHIRGDRMYTSGWGGKIEIYDVSNLASKFPTYLGAINGNSTNHSTWTSEDGKYLYSCRETFDGDLRIYDVQNPASPFLVRSIRASDLNINAISPHNPVVMGNYLYVSWYQAGTQVFDISVPTDPKRVGQYDTFEPTFAPPENELLRLQTEGPWDSVCGSPNALSSALPTSYGGNWAVFPFLGQNKVLSGDMTNGLLILDASNIAGPQRNRVSDFDGDRKTDLGVYTGATGVWKTIGSSSGVVNSEQFGAVGDVALPADYDGDGITDIAVFRPSSGYWYIKAANGGYSGIKFGTNGDVPVPADYDADGKIDIAVWRPADGVWYILQSTLGFKAAQWGTAGDKPLTGDYDGDGKPDLTVWRPSDGVWYTLQSSSSTGLYSKFGLNGDKPLLGDFDGNGIADYAVYRPSIGAWYLLDPVTQAFKYYQFGIAEDIPVPGDYDDDGKADIAVFRPSSNIWYRIGSSDGAFAAGTLGQSGDTATPSSVQPR